MSSLIPGFFITGTDTDVGKTYATACIGLSLKHNGFKVSPRKPIASGCKRLPDGTLLSEDALYIQQACSPHEPLAQICPYTFEPAISPQRALMQSQTNLTTLDLVKACDTQAGHIALVEGAGGFYSPLSINGLNVDLAQALQLPVILVVGNQLGCINHTLLTLAAIQKAELSLYGVIVNDIHPNANKDNFKDIQCYLAQHHPLAHCFHLAYSDSFSPVIIPELTMGTSV